MSLKDRNRFVCQQCAYAAAKWLGRCPECGAWNSLTEERAPGGAADRRFEGHGGAAEPLPITRVSRESAPRIPLPLAEVNRVLGGGLTRGSVVLLAGDPGIGKSTLLLKLLGALAGEHERPLLYVTGEESARQIRMRGERLRVVNDGLRILPETDLSRILAHCETLSPEIVAVDSVQTLFWPELESIPGSVSQVREVADRLVRFAKRHEVALFLVGHVTKEGAVAGPMALEHLVDTVLKFEGERGQPYRILRAHKNRFGPTDEIGVFDMKEDGLREVANPSELFLRDRFSHTPGTVVFAALEGSRPLLVEVQGLASRSSYGVPLRSCNGFDKNRLTMLLAVLEKKARLNFSDQDVFVNVVGGLTLTEPAADLAVAASVLSSALGKIVPARTVLFGEVGLAGEVRAVARAEARLKEAAKLGFTEAIVPERCQPESGKISCHRARNVDDLRRYTDERG